ncbi:MAG: hypothetical protein LBU34_05295 [Planctomycetaceae bacterium]|jgi:hypothetical protein|nr:hypothetical protein [Planctomycetaceae bacterium]
MYPIKFFVTAIFCCIFVLPLFAEQNPEIDSVRVGIEGFYKNGLWTPITVEWAGIENQPITISISCLDSDGTPIIYRYANPFRTTPNRTSVYAKLGRKTGTLTVKIETQNGISIQKQIRPSGDPVKQKTLASLQNQLQDQSQNQLQDRLQDRFWEPVLNERPIYLIVGNEDIGLQGAVAELSLREDRRPILVKVNSFAELPKHWFGFEAVEMVVLTTTEPQQFDNLTADSLQIKALNDWVRLGGKLFFCAGQNSEVLLKNPNSALRNFLPGNFSEMTELRQGTPLELFVGSKRSIFMNGTDAAPFMKMPRFTEPKGLTFVRDGDLPLVLRCAHGFGTIIYFGGDLSGKPLDTWRDRVALVRNILQWNVEKQPRTYTSDSISGAMIQLGYNDISGQVRSALDRFDDVYIVPFSVILIILTVYWLVVGLFDWFLVHKILKRPVSTWITFPCWIILFSVLTYYLASSGRPDKAILNELDLIDIDGTTGDFRYSSWGHLYSPGDAKFSLSLNTQPFLPPDVSSSTVPCLTLFSWNGLSGAGLGGMAPKTVSPTIWQTNSTQEFYNETSPYPSYSLRSITDVPVQVRSTKSFFGQSWLELRDSFNSAAFVSSQSTSPLSDEEGIPVGFLEWSRRFPALDNCILVYGRWVQEIGTVEPGQKITVGKTTPRRELRDLLLTKETSGDATLRRLAMYNPQSTDLDYIIRVLSLHGILGGYESTGLYNTFQKSLDMSELLSVDRALLIGTVRNPLPEQPGSLITGNNIENRRKIIFRQSLPITLTALSPRLKLEQKIIKDDILAPPFDPAKTKEGHGEYQYQQNK